MRGGERGRCDTAEAEGQPLRAVVERMLGRGGMEMSHGTRTFIHYEFLIK